MFDIAPTELLLCAIVALLVIGPKDLPKAMRVVGHWVGRARGMARHFRSGFDAMVREAELEEMEKKWAAENARIMREHPMADETAAEPAAYEPAPPETTPMPDIVDAPVAGYAGMATGATQGDSSPADAPAEPAAPARQSRPRIAKGDAAESAAKPAPLPSAFDDAQLDLGFGPVDDKNGK